MDYIKLGNTGLDISPLAIGAMTYGDPDRGHPVWSLGEDESRLLAYLDEHATTMPRTALRYSLERLSPEMRAHYMGAKKRTGTVR